MSNQTIVRASRIELILDNHVNKTKSNREKEDLLKSVYTRVSNAFDLVSEAYISEVDFSSEVEDLESAILTLETGESVKSALEILNVLRLNLKNKDHQTSFKQAILVAYPILIKELSTYIFTINNKFDRGTLVKHLKDVYIQKNTAYGNSVEESIINYGFVASLVRLSDKTNRFETLTSNESIDHGDESVFDTALDAILYCAMTLEIYNKISEEY